MAIRKSSNSGIPFGNTAGRPASPSTGQPYFNGEAGRLELYTSNGWQNIVQETPGIASISGTYNESTGSGTFIISGTNFVSGGIAYAVGTNGTEYQATTSTINSVVQMTALFTGLSAAYEPYDIKVLNPSNLFGLLPDAFYINDSPVWSTTTGSLGTWNGSSIQLAATDDESNTITYSVTSGSLPTGLSLSSAGLISGTSTASGGTYTFTVSASDGSNTAVTRSFSITIPFPTVSGGTITLSGLYRIHSFTSSGTLAIQNGSVDTEYLIVAGGGGGGSRYGGGGGAGGMITGSTSLSSGNHSILIGGGGAGATMGPGDSTGGGGASGVNSSINAISATGGGGGGSADDFTSGKNGGSGGGAFSGSIGQGISGQGNNGGTGSGTGTYPYKCGGGGGAGGVGENANTSAGYGGAGGVGLQSSITGTSTYYAGGGGGGSHNPYSSRSISLGGAGGGGNSGNYGQRSPGQNGSTNTGGGAGGASTDSSGDSNTIGGVGGSGIVIVRYLKSAVGL
jgi:hypothetical protein